MTVTVRAVWVASDSHNATIITSSEKHNCSPIHLKLSINPKPQLNLQETKTEEENQAYKVHWVYILAIMSQMILLCFVITQT